MSTRYQVIERIRRAVYGEQPTDDANITVNLVNHWLNDGIALAAKQNYNDNIRLDNLTYLNNSFFTTFKNIAIAAYEDFLYQAVLPQLPLGIGKNEGISTVQIVDVNGSVSDPAIPLSEQQLGYYRSMRPIPNKMLYYPESIYVYLISDIQLFNYTLKVRIVSGGDSTNLNSVLNVPDDYLKVATDYCIAMLRQERMQPQIISNTGEDRA